MFTVLKSFEYNQYINCLYIKADIQLCKVALLWQISLLIPFESRPTRKPTLWKKLMVQWTRQWRITKRSNAIILNNDHGNVILFGTLWI